MADTADLQLPVRTTWLAMRIVGGTGHAAPGRVPQ
jgi:hypothetical protein